MRARILQAGLTALVILGTAGSAGAAPIFSLVFTGTTGSGTSGASVIDAQAGDTVTLDVLLDPNGETYTSGWDFDLLGTGVTAVSGQECPAGSSAGSLENFVDGNCYLGGGTMGPIVHGVTVSGSDVLNYDAGGTSPGWFGEDGEILVWVGRGVFTVTGPLFIELEGLYGLPDYSLIPIYAATVPEPGTVALMGLGLAALGLARRRRSG